MTNISGKIKRINNNYWKPTPLKLRKIGDSLLAASTTLAGAAIIADYPKIGITVAIIGAIGKFMTNFWSKAEDSTEENN
jgi:hypothetical protein